MILPFDAQEDRNYQYVVLEVSADFPASRDEIVDALHEENILERRHLWPGCHQMKPYGEFYPHARLVLPNTQAVAERVIVLPTGTTLPEGAAEVVANVCRALATETDRAGKR